MEGKILKVSVIILLIITMTMANFIFVGNTLFSYAVDNISTNNDNIEFSAYFKDDNGEKTTNIEKSIQSSNTNLYFYVKVKKQGYFDGKIILEEGNFKLKEVENEWINKIEANTITLNQINAEKEIEIEVPIEFMQSEQFNVSLLNMDSKIKLEGIYKDSSEKDKQIKADKTVTLKLISESETPENIENSAKVITNKTLVVAGQNKRVVQVLLNLGLKDNSYPIKEIDISSNVPNMNQEQPEVSVVTDLNTMSKYTYNYDNGQIDINLKNEPTEQNCVLWKNEGNEKVILTYLYKTNNLEDIAINGKIYINLYDDKKIETDIPEILINKDEEKEEIVTANVEETETAMYKGKLYQGIDREYTTIDSINVNTTGILNYMEIREEDVFASQADYENDIALQGTKANIVYGKTIINKNQLFNVLGENGNAIIRNENGDNVAVITNDTQTDENGDIVIDYGAEGQSGIVIKTTTPISAGKIDIKNCKIIKQNDENLIRNSVSFNTKLFVTTNLNSNQETIAYPNNIKTIELKDTMTEATIEIDRKDLSTVLENEITLKAILKSQSEANDLYKNPVLNIEFPEEVEEITINNVSIMYEDELKIKDCQLNERVLTIQLEGEQTYYSESAIQGANVIINGKIKLNKKSASKDSQIIMTYSNEKAKAYINEGKAVSDIKIVAPTDVTTVTTIEQLNIDEIGQDTTKEISLARGTEAKEITPQIEVINNKETTIKDVKVLGTFPTGNKEGEVGIDVTSSIQTENGKVYYTENENATDDLSNEENQWSEEITNSSAVKKYLITAEQIEPQGSIVASYNAVIPANLEYNENASQDYQVNYIDGETNLSDTVKSTQLKMTTGIGPKLQAKVKATVGSNELNNGDEVKAGEVIKYHLEISNIGTETANNVTISAPVPEGTTYVKAKDEFENEGTSYYEEVDKDKYEEEIAQVNPEETIVREYEVRVNSNISNETNITNECIAKFDDVITESNKLENKAKPGNIRVSIKRITANDVILYKDQTIEYYILVENISSQNQEKVILKNNLSDGLKVNKVSLTTGKMNEDEELKSENIEYSNEIDLGDFSAGEQKLLYYTVKPQVGGEINLSMVAKQGNDEYRSNLWKDTIVERKAEISMTSEQSKYVKNGDKIEYTINVANTGTADMSDIGIEDEVSDYLKIDNITVDGEEKEIPEDNDILIGIDVPKGEQKSIKVTASVLETDNEENPIMITNKALAEYMGEEISTTEEITHIIQPTEKSKDDGRYVGEDDDGDDIQTNNSSNNPSQGGNSGNIAQGTRIISGIAWFDQNANGKKDSDETILSGVKVSLLNAETNQFVKDKSGNNIVVTTSDNGTYMLTNIPNGKYIVIFNYNTTQYALTQYKVTGVNEGQNSNVMMSEIVIEGQNQKVASTDMIEINNTNISDINIGLIKLQNFDLQLEKFVSKIIVQNSAGTTVTEYNNSTMAKTEIHSKQIDGSTVLIEYKIKVTNIGEVEGYVKKIADYIPSDLKFSSELNKDWYQSGTNLYNTSLANEKIASGESRELTLTLTKSMTEDNTGRINNTAEIVEAYNELGIEDSNSTPGNKTKGENDMGSADVIISIGTGAIIFYSTVTIVVIIAILSGITIPLVKKSKKQKTRHKFDKV